MAGKGEKLEQWCSKVTDFSSQYGSETNISYTVSNIVGPSQLFPSYGDFTQSAVLRTYGPWWVEAPSAPEPITRTPPSFISKDFIELQFETEVYPTEIQVYETYNPGCVVRILAADTSTPSLTRWWTLYSGQPQNPERKARMFSPKLRQCPFKTNVIRLEFNSEHVDYYSEIDAVRLLGVTKIRYPAARLERDYGTNVDTGLRETSSRPSSPLCCCCDAENTVISELGVASLSSKVCDITNCCQRVYCQSCGQRKEVEEKDRGLGAGLRSEGAGLRSEGAGLRSEGAGLKSEGAGLKSEGAGLRSEGAGLRSEGAGLRSEGAGLNSNEVALTLEKAGLRGEGDCNGVSVEEFTDITDSTEVSETLTEHLAKLHMQDGLSAVLDFSDNGYFDDCPDEVIQLILSFLDLQSLCRLAAVSRLFHKHAYDPLQYTELNLQPYWPKVTDVSLWNLSSRSQHLQRADLSWCGSHNSITEKAFIRYMFVMGTNLTCLRLACCPVVTNSVMEAIAKACTNLQELDLQCNQRVDIKGYSYLRHLSKLQRVNLYRSHVDVASLLAMIRACPELSVLNLGSCKAVNSFDDVAIALGQHSKKLRCLDVWRARSLTDLGLNAIADNCPLLEELDVGWCINLRANTNCFQNLAQKCRRLKKVFFTANRTVSDRELIALADNCPLLEQVDILGTREVSEDTVIKVLDQCKRLRFFDVSFCAGIELLKVDRWRLQYPQVAIKRSFQG